MSDTISNPNPSHWNALRKIVKRLPANLAYYGSALGAIVLAGGGQLPPGLEFVAGSIGGNMLSNMISDILKDEDLLDEEIRKRAEDAITQSDIANLLTQQDFLQGYARLIQRLDAQKTISQDILDELRTGFSKVATADQVEELKRLILQLMQQPPQVVARKARLFISYARKDDEPFVERLYHGLREEFDVWWDRETMSNRGKTFLQEIRDAIDHADRLLLVAGPRAFASDYVRDEWQYAYETYKGINIALRFGDYTDFPAQLSGFDAPDFRSDANYNEQLATLKRQLAEPIAPIGAFHNVPAMPPHFLNRPEALDALRELIIADVDKPTLISAEKRTTAVEGMGGIGKSVLAAAFAYDRKVRFAFPDGIVWLTAGRGAKLYELYRAVGIALGDDLSNYPDETTARQNAQNALAGKKCLLIMDDVWELPIGRAFRDLISGTVARLLITTRNLQINDLLNANEYRLKLIDQSQAADYMRSWVGDDPALETIAEKLGYLFLALKLAGARMKKDGLSGTDYLRIFDRVSRMKIGPKLVDREDSLEASISLSVDAAFTGIEDDRLLYHTFGIFQEDTPIPQQTILQLWRYLRPDADEFDLLETLNALVDLALVERNADDRTITLHDLLHSYTREKLGDRYVQTHQDLLDSYGVEEWHQLSPDEPYLWWQIAYHLLEAGQLDTLYALLLDYRFLQVKLNATDVNALIEDCETYLTSPLTPTEKRQDEDDSMVRLLQSALRNAMHVLNNDKDALAHQIVGRLMMWRRKVPQIHTFTEAVMDNVPGLYPAYPDSDYAVLNQAGGRLLRTLVHPSVSSALELGDGRLLSWGERALRLWSADGDALGELRGHTARVRGALELSDGRLLSWSADNTLRLWSADGEALTELRTGWVSGALELGDGRILSWVGKDGPHIKDHTLQLWSADGDALGELRGHTRWVNGALELSDGKLVSWAETNSFVNHGEGTLRLWSADGEALTELRGHTEPVRGALELSDGRLLSWSSDLTLRLWSADGEALGELRGHTHIVEGALRLSDGRFLSWSGDHTLRLWSADGEALGELRGHTARVRGALELSDGWLLSWSEAEDTLRLWSADGEALGELRGHTAHVRGALGLSDGGLLSWSSDGTLRLWSADRDAVAEQRGHTDTVTDTLGLDDEFTSQRGGRILSWAGDFGSKDHTLRLWSTDGNVLAELLGHTARVRGALGLSDGRILSWSEDKTLRLWSADGNVLAELLGHTKLVLGALVLDDEALSQRGRRLLSWSGDHTLRLWSADGDALTELRGHTDHVRGALGLSDGRILSWGANKTLRLWSADGDALGELRKHTDRLLDALGFSELTYTVVGALELSNGRILSWSSDKTLRLWSADGNVLAELRGHTKMVIGALELSDGRILSWSSDHTLRLWSVDGESLADLEQDYYRGYRAIIGVWAAQHGYTLADFYPTGKFDPFMAGVLQRQDNGLVIYDLQTGKMLHAFYGDADIRTRPVVLDGGRIVAAGDSTGRVLFLRYQSGNT